MPLNNQTSRQSLRATKPASTRAKLLASGSTSPAENFPAFGTSLSESLDFNASGWPSQHYLGSNEANPQTNNVNDCMSLWNSLLSVSSLTAASNTSADYQARYLGNGICRYTKSTSNLSFTYNSNSGKVNLN